MGILRPLVERAQSVNQGEARDQSERIATIPTAFTAMRPPLGAEVMRRLIKGKSPVLRWVFGCFITDMEGLPARLVDKYYPDSGLGSSKFGKRADIVADTIAAFEVSSGVILGPKVSKLGKVAVAVVLIQEGVKASWAVPADARHKRLTGKPLDLDVSYDGKEAMAEKMMAIGFAAWSSDIDNPLVKTAMGLTSLGFAVSGAMRGHNAFLDFREEGEEIIASAEDAYLRPIP